MATTASQVLLASAEKLHWLVYMSALFHSTSGYKAGPIHIALLTSSLGGPGTKRVPILSPLPYHQEYTSLPPLW